MKVVADGDEEIVFKLIPSCEDLFTIIRAAGPSNSAKAGAVSRALDPLREALAPRAGGVRFCDAST